MKGYWLIILFFCGWVSNGTAQKYWSDLTDNERNFLAHSGKVTPEARGYFQDPSLQLTDSTQAHQLLAEIGSCDKQHLPFYWQLFSQVNWPSTIDTVVAASHLFNLLERYPRFVIGYYQLNLNKRTQQRYIDYLAKGYQETPWLYPSVKEVKKKLRRVLPRSYRKTVRQFIKQLEAAF